MGVNCARYTKIPWPSLPWVCPGCGTKYRTHAYTIASAGPRFRAPGDKLQAPTAAEMAAATFLCVPCDLTAFEQEFTN